MLVRGSLRDPVLDRHIVSISEVRVSPDLRHATAYVMPVGGDPAIEAAVLAALNAHARQLKGELARRVNTKYAADLHFRVDESFRQAARIDALLRSPKVARDLARQTRSRPDPADEDQP
jgi:ribosome-binding factor A